jgi:hypothetical protein
LITEKLIIGDILGSVPPETPMAPLQVDFNRHIKRLRMPLEVYDKKYDLDLRKPNDLERSHLLHRLLLLEVPWGTHDGAAVQVSGSGRGGTFHEIWQVCWQPEYAVLLIEAGQWGNTIASAAAARVCHDASRAENLAALTRLVEDVLLAELPEAIQHVMNCLQAEAALSSDIPRLMEALPPLANVLRYGNVRQTDSTMIAEVVDGLVARVTIGLPNACSALNDEAAAEMFARILEVDDSINRLANDGYHQQWRRALTALAEMDAPNVLLQTHGLIAGRSCRILLDCGVFPPAEAARRLGLALSTAAEPAQAGDWVEGFLRGSGQLLIYDDGLLSILDGWLGRMPEQGFEQLLPLLRRTFATFTAPERRKVGEMVRRRAPGRRLQSGKHRAADENFDAQRAASVLPLAALLLGAPWEKE